MARRRAARLKRSEKLATAGWLSIGQAADLAGVCRGTIYNWMAAGLDVLQCGSRRYIKRAVLIAFARGKLGEDAAKILDLV